MQESTPMAATGKSDTKSGNRWLRDPRKFSKAQLAVFVLAFGIIGYLLIKTFAASPVLTTIEAENLLPNTPPPATTTTTSVLGPNLALNRPASASSVEGNNASLVAANAFDGSTSTRWSSNYSDPQWVKVDLGSTQQISTVVVTWTTTANSWEVAYAKAYQIQTSNDNQTWTTIYSTTTNTGGTQTLSVNGSGRYIRMYGTQRASKYGYSLWEMAVYGPQTTASSTTNLALKKPATASSVEGNHSSLAAANAFDGSTTTRWSSNYSDPQWVSVDLGSVQTINKVVITWTTTQDSWEVAYAKAYQIQVSSDNQNWTTVYSTTAGTGGTQTLSVTGSGRYVRMYGTQRASKYGYSLWEMAVYGPGTTTSPTPATPLTVVNDSAASGGKALEYTGSATATGSFSISGSATSITATARGTACSGTSPNMAVTIDNNQVLSTTTSASSWTAYTANVNIPAGSHSISVSSSNSNNSSTCPVNLFVDKVDVLGASPPPAPVVTLSSNPASITSGQASTLTWSSTNAASCSAPWTSSTATSGTQSVSPTSTTSYTVTCTGSGGSGSKTASVSVTAPAPSPSPTPSPTGYIKGYYDQGPNMLTEWNSYKTYGFNMVFANIDSTLLAQIKADGGSAMVQPNIWQGCSYSYSTSTALGYAQSAVNAGRISAFYVADEPSTGCSTAASQIAAWTAALHQNFPNIPTVIAVYDSSALSAFKNSADMFALDPYPCQYGNGCNYSWITQLAAAADQLGIKYVGVPQAFGGDGHYDLPTATQLTQIMNTWRATKELGYVIYAFSAEGMPSADYVQNHPELMAVLQAQNAL